MICKNGPVHKHATVQESKVCWGVIPAGSAPIYPTAPTPAPTPVVSRPTPRMIRYVAYLKGDVTKAEGMTFDECSKYIDELKGKKVTEPSTVETKVPLELLQRVPDGYYAVREDDLTAYTFLRISRPKAGRSRSRFAGATKVQTQHSDDLKLAWVLWPSGRVSLYNPQIENKLFMVIADYQGAALQYGQEIGHCARCNKSLTDERSRHYGIGPDCEEFWPWAIMRVDEKWEASWETLQARK